MLVNGTTNSTKIMYTGLLKVVTLDESFTKKLSNMNETTDEQNNMNTNFTNEIILHVIRLLAKIKQGNIL